MIKAIDKWLLPVLKRSAYRRPTGKQHVILSVCDHFEPLHDTDKAGAMKRLADWKTRFPQLRKECESETGIAPRHTFFFPIEQYDRDLLSEIGEICALTESEVEVHLHHEDDTEETLREQLLRGVDDLASHAGMICSDAAGNRRYAFIHGNWALDNSNPEGLSCGVNNELGVLRETGCYADFTMPSAPHPAQTKIVNSIYYATDGPEPKSHDRGVIAAKGRNVSCREAQNQLLLIQGPLALNWERRKLGVLPKVENGDLTGLNPPLPDRWRLWQKTGIRVEGADSWIFVKLHTHGGIPQNYNTLLGDPMKEFVKFLGTQLSTDPDLAIHWVTARQMVNLVHAAEDGVSGDPSEHYDYLYKLS